MLAHADRDVEMFGKHYSKGEFLPFYIPRAEMPQVDEADLPILVHKAVVKSVEPTFEVVSPKSLHAHQHVDIDLARKMPIEVKLKPLIASLDGYIVDGNHRWWANVHDGNQAVNIIRLGLSFEKAIDWLLTLPFVYKITPKSPIRN